MTPEQTKKYEEAAIDWAYNRLIDRRLHQQDLRDAYFEGCTFTSQDTEERVKQAHNEAIDKVINLLLENRWCFDTEDDREFVNEEIQKLKL